MNAKPLYEEDFHAWALAQARVLRRLRSQVAAISNEIDLDRVIEEIEDLGNEQRSRVESNLVQALIHLLKIVSMPDDPAVRHWTKEVNAFLDNSRGAYTASMARAISIERVWSRAVRRIAEDFAVDEIAPPPLPKASPLPLADLIDEAITTRHLLLTLQGSLTGKASP